MTEEATWESKFLAGLRALAPSDDPEHWNRGALAELRRGLGTDTWRVLARVGGLFVAVPDWAIEDAVLIGGLFATHPKAVGQGTLGAAFALIRDESDSIEKRFVALLDADKDDLPNHLRHAISLLKAKDEKAPLGWLRLLQDVCDWNRGFRSVQQKWARDFWAENQSKQPETASTAVAESANT